MQLPERLQPPGWRSPPNKHTKTPHRPHQYDLQKQHIESDHPIQHSSKLPNMPDDNLAIILTLFLLFIVIGVGAWFGRKWIKAFTTAMVQAKQAERDNEV